MSPIGSRYLEHISIINDVILLDEKTLGCILACHVYTSARQNIAIWEPPAGQNCAAGLSNLTSSLSGPVFWLGIASHITRAAVSFG